jgi:hypothetical protein
LEAGRLDDGTSPAPGTWAFELQHEVEESIADAVDDPDKHALRHHSPRGDALHPLVHGRLDEQDRVVVPHLLELDRVVAQQVLVGGDWAREADPKQPLRRRLPVFGLELDHRDRHITGLVRVTSEVPIDRDLPWGPVGRQGGILGVAVELPVGPVPQQGIVELGGQDLGHAQHVGQRPVAGGDRVLDVLKHAHGRRSYAALNRSRLSPAHGRQGLLAAG